jgi:hypothetical protein
MKREAAPSPGPKGAPETDTAHYQAILDEVQANINGFPPNLQAGALAFFEFLAPGEFTKVVALLPYWLLDLLPVSPDICHKLGVAHLYGWWYYAAQDELLDGAASPDVMLAAHLALLKMVEGYRILGVTGAPCWAEFEALARTSAESYMAEVQSRFTTLSEVTPGHLTPWSIEFIISRASPFYFNTLAHLHLAGIPATSPLHQVLPEAIAYFGAARQIGDDADDWLEDLKKGHLNYVSAQLMRRFGDERPAANDQALDLNRLAGYSLTDEAFWQTIEQTAQSLARQALAITAPFAPCRLQTLIEYQLAHNAEAWQEGRRNRARQRLLFGLDDSTVKW